MNRRSFLAAMLAARAAPAFVPFGSLMVPRSVAAGEAQKLVVIELMLHEGGGDGHGESLSFGRARLIDLTGWQAMGWKEIARVPAHPDWTPMRLPGGALATRTPS